MEDEHAEAVEVEAWGSCVLPKGAPEFVRDGGEACACGSFLRKDWTKIKLGWNSQREDGTGRYYGHFLEATTA